MARTTRSIASGLSSPVASTPSPRLVMTYSRVSSWSPGLVRINDEHAARHRPDVNCGIPPAVHYFSPKIGSSSLEYHVSGAGMLPGTMLAVNVESLSRSRPYTVTAFSPFETQPNS